MKNTNEIEFKDLSVTNLIIDAIYKRGPQPNTASEPISKIMQCENQGGFRKRGSTGNLKYVVLYTKLNDYDWPDYIDSESGMFIYYGDNKKPGNALHETVKKGNEILRNIFDDLHKEERVKIPPIFVFASAGQRDVTFKGLAIPGHPGYGQTEDLVAIWKTSNKGRRFQNYKAVFSILDESTIDRHWLTDIIDGKVVDSDYCPKVYKKWVESGKVDLLRAPKVRSYRTKEEQTPSSKSDIELLKYVIKYYKDKGNAGNYEFEKFAAELLLKMDKNFLDYDLTQPSRDGGRDAIGDYKIGLESNSVKVTFSLEAKLYSLNNSVGVKETSRLISRLLHRQFGVLVTTSFVAKQAYKEIREEDNHPIIFVSGIDIINILKNSGLSNKKDLKVWLDSL